MTAEGKRLYRVTAYTPCVDAPFAPALALFRFDRYGRTFEVDGFIAVAASDLRPPTSDEDDPEHGWWLATPTQAQRMLKLAREHAPYWIDYQLDRKTPGKKPPSKNPRKKAARKRA